MPKSTAQIQSREETEEMLRRFLVFQGFNRSRYENQGEFCGI